MASLKKDISVLLKVKIFEQVYKLISMVLIF